MLRKFIATLTTAIAVSAPAIALAQPPSPPEIVHKVDRGVRRTVTNLDRKLRHTTHRTRHGVRYATHRNVRAYCNDGRVHIGRTRTSACASHGGIR